MREDQCLRYLMRLTYKTRGDLAKRPEKCAGGLQPGPECRSLTGAMNSNTGAGGALEDFLSSGYSRVQCALAV